MFVRNTERGYERKHPAANLTPMRFPLPFPYKPVHVQLETPNLKPETYHPLISLQPGVLCDIYDGIPLRIYQTGGG